MARAVARRPLMRMMINWAGYWRNLIHSDITPLVMIRLRAACAEICLVSSVKRIFLKRFTSFFRIRWSFSPCDSVSRVTLKSVFFFVSTCRNATSRNSRSANFYSTFFTYFK